MVFWLIHGVSFHDSAAKKIDVCAKFEVHLSLSVPPLVVSQSSETWLGKHCQHTDDNGGGNRASGLFELFCESFLA